MATDIIPAHPLSGDIPDDNSFLPPGSQAAERYGCLCRFGSFACSIGCPLHRQRALRERCAREWQKIFGGFTKRAYHSVDAHLAARMIAMAAGVPSEVTETILADKETLQYYWRIAAKVSHPDRADDKAAAHEKFITLQCAYETLLREAV